MRSPTSKLEVIGGCLLAAFAAFAVLRHGHLLNPKIQARPTFQIDVLKQEEAFPGKVVRVVMDGREELNYRCRAQDAAVAVVTVREKSSGLPVAPHLSNAHDESGRKYQIIMRTSGQVTLIALEHGFPKRPSFVTVVLTAGPITAPMYQVEFKLTRIADSHRLVQIPKHADERATAVFDDLRGALEIIPNRKFTDNEGFDPHLIATSFGAGTPVRQDLPYLNFVFPDNTGRDIDACRVALDLVRYEESTVTLTYRNAIFEEGSGRRFIQLPDRQKVGEIFDYEAFMGPIQRSVGSKSLNQSESTRGLLFIRLNPKVQGQKTLEPGMPGYEPPPVLNLIDISPTPGSMGFSSIKVRLLEPNSVGAANSGFEDVIYAKGPVNQRPPAAIPELTIRLQVKKPRRISSETVDLPVRHVQAGR